MKIRKQKNNRILVHNRLVQSKENTYRFKRNVNHQQLISTYLLNENYKIEIKLNFNIAHDSLLNIIQSVISLQTMIHTHLMNQSSKY